MRKIFDEWWDDAFRFNITFDKKYHVFTFCKEHKDAYKIAFLTDKELNQETQIKLTNYLLENYYPVCYEKFIIECKGFKDGITEKIEALECNKEINKCKEHEIIEDLLKPEDKKIVAWLKKQFNKS